MTKPMTSTDDLDEILNDFKLEPRGVDLNAYDAKLKLKQALLKHIQEAERLARIDLLERICCCCDDPIKEPKINACSDHHKTLLAALSSETDK